MTGTRPRLVSGSAPVAAPGSDPRRRRLPPEARREEFIARAIEFFAEQGFESSTRDLARRLGVTQPLLYRYFPSKDDLIAEVYNKVYVGRWRPEWEGLIADRSRPLDTRVAEFYRAYTDAIFKPEWIRIFLYSGLKGVEINKRYLALVVDRLIDPIIAECRHVAGASPRPPSEDERDLALMLHGGVFYYGVIRSVYQGETLERKDAAIDRTVRAMIAGLVAMTGEARP